MNRIVVTKLEHHQTEYLAYLVLDENRKLQELQVFEPEENTLLDHIYVGYVEKIVPNIHAAFVRIADGQKCYLPLNDVKNPVYTRKLSKKEALCEGDELLVQVVKDAVKTKDPVVSTKLVVHGHYCFLSTENTCLSVSKKLSQEESKRLSALLQNMCKDHEAEGYGLVFRTNAGAVPETELCEDIELVQKEYRALKKTGTHQNAGDLVYRNLPGYLARLKAENFEKTDLVLTDGQDLYQEICAYLPHLVEEKKVQLYRDDAVSLSTLYHLRGNMQELLSSKVWLDSGANIIIESLETLTVIDVNSGKNEKKSAKEEMILKTDEEAVTEAMRQIRLRNLSGIILIDLIDVHTKETQASLLKRMRYLASLDPAGTQAVDITKLNLAEIVRKKSGRPFADQLQ